MESERFASLLKEFCDDIDAAGGVTRSDGGLYAPVGDPEWIDLGELYFKVCTALGRTPVIDDYLNDE